MDAVLDVRSTLRTTCSSCSRQKFDLGTPCCSGARRTPAPRCTSILTIGLERTLSSLAASTGRYDKQLSYRKQIARKLRTQYVDGIILCLIMLLVFFYFAHHSLLSASLYVSKRGAYWDRLCRDVVGRWLVVTRVHCGQTVHPKLIVTMQH